MPELADPQQRIKPVGMNGEKSPEFWQELKKLYEYVRGIIPPDAGLGNVVGPVGATANAPALFDGTSGLLLKSGTTNQLVPTSGATSGFFLGYAGGVPTWQANTPTIADGSIILPKLANQAAGTFLARKLAAGAGAPTALTASEARFELGIVIRPEDFALGTDALNLAAAFAAGIATGTPVRLDGTYTLTAALATVSMTTGSLTVIGNGVINITSDFATPAILFDATYPTAVSISAFLLTTRTFPGAASVTDATRITAAGHGLSIGDLFKVVAEEQIAISPEATSRVGEFAYAADISGNDIYVAGPLLNTYTTTPRLVRVRTEAKLIWDGPRFSATAAQTSWDTVMLRVRGFAFPYVRTVCENGYDQGVSTSSCFMAKIDVAGRNFRNRVVSEDTSGYLLLDSASAYTQADIRGADARHFYTSDSPTTAVNGAAYLYGQTVGAVIRGTGYASSSAAFDTHPEAIDVSFVNVSGGANRIGENASGALVALRGIRNRAINVLDRGSNAGVTFFAMTAGGCVDCSARNVDYAGVKDGIRIADSGSDSVTRPWVHGAKIRTSAARSFPIWACTGAQIDDLTITPTGSATHEAIVLAGDANVLIRRLVIDLAEYTGTTFRAIAFVAATTGNNLRVESARLINGSGKFSTWLHGHSAVGTVTLGDLTSDVAPSAGIAVGIENLNSYLLEGVPYSVIGSAAPTTGTWARGDMVWSTTPTAAGKRAWVCVTAGTPGTWKLWGAIDA
jgi:hypothetical protein